LAAGAVLGKAFSFQHAVSVAGLEEETALSALDELLVAGLLIETPSGDDPGQPRYLFSHDKLREVVRLETNAARRARLHRRAFEALEASDASPGELSHHALAGGLREQAFQTGIQAGDQAMQVYALREAVGYYRSALEVGLPEGRPSLPGAEGELPGLFLNLGRAQELLNEFEPARRTYLRMADFAQQTHRADLKVIALNRQATLLAWQDFNIVAARGLLQDAQSLAETSGDRAGLFETTWNLAQLGVYTADPRALEHAQAALALARGLESPELLARAWNTVAHAHSNSYHWQEVEQAARGALEINQFLQDRAMQAENLALISQAQVCLGKIDEGVVSGKRALGIAMEIENTWGQVFASFALGLALVDAGEFEQALDVTRNGVEVAGQFQFPALRVLSMVAHGVACLSLFQVEESLELLDEAKKFNLMYGELNLYGGMIGCLECAAHLQAGESELAARAAESAVQARRNRPGQGGNLPIWLEVEALLATGKEEVARLDFEQLSAQPREHTRQRFTWLVCRGILAHHAGRVTDALPDLLEALQLARRAGSPMERIGALVELARACHRAGQPAKAESYREEAESLVNELAARIQDETLRGQFFARSRNWLARD
jgi:tetratricopeptide (TPR) repeat protein